MRPAILHCLYLFCICMCICSNCLLSEKFVKAKPLLYFSNFCLNNCKKSREKMSSSIKVAVRVRPFNMRERDMDAQCIVQMESKRTRLLKAPINYNKQTVQIRDVANRETHHDFTFDYSYWSFDVNDKHFITQEQVYNDLGTDVVDCAFQGYNACVFAYGQTGSGKTFTMMGSPDNPGLIPRICQALFNRMRIGQESGTGYKTHASYLEIYNERVKDLLASQSVGHGLRVREHRTLGPYVENLSQYAVNDFDEIQECIKRGNIQRTTASTNMNDTSSRSHAIFTITFVQAVFMNDMPSETVSKIHLVDLAGSERANATGATGQRLKEGAHINKSLVTLGSVISALAEQTHGNHNTINANNSLKRTLYIPYRDSILTWLLKDSLGGNSKTIMIAALSPADCNYSETLSTLRYANRAKNIINKPTINEDGNVKLIRELREEINKLKSLLACDLNTYQQPTSAKMLEDLHKKEAQEKVLTEEWTEKWKEAQSILREQKSLGLRKSGVGVVLDSEMPHLIGIHNDITTGVTLYSLKEGETKIGSTNAHQLQDIELSGDGIQPEHCIIILKDGLCILHPLPQAQCWLNANLIDEPKQISQGDIILLGRTNIFRFNNPAQAALMRKGINHSSQLDMSRLTLLTTSRENLLNNSIYNEIENVNISDGSSFNSFNSSPLKYSQHCCGDTSQKQYYPTKPITRDDPEFQDENRKILQTIENALKQLSMERVQMREQYKSKAQKFSDEVHRLATLPASSPSPLLSLPYLECRKNELLARNDMLLWEKNNEKVQIDIVCRQISTLQTQLDSKKRDFTEYVAKELQELHDCNKLDEMILNMNNGPNLTHDMLLQAADSLEPYGAQFIKETVKKMNEEIQSFEELIADKENILNISTKKILQFDDSLLEINEQIQQLHEQRQQYLRNQQDGEIDREEAANQEDIDKSKSLSLNLNRMNNRPSTITTPTMIPTTCVTPLTSSTSYSSTFNSYASSIELDVNANHSNNNSNHTNSNDNKSGTDNLKSALMSDSGVCLDHTKFSSSITTTATVTPAQTLMLQCQLNGGNTPCGSLDLTGRAQTSSLSSSEPLSLTEGNDGQGKRQYHIDHDHYHNNNHNCPMEYLKYQISAQKTLIMKNLEMNVNKMQFDLQVAELQELQRKFIKMEKELLDNKEQEEEADGNLQYEQNEQDIDLCFNENVLEEYERSVQRQQQQEPQLHSNILDGVNYVLNNSNRVGGEPEGGVDLVESTEHIISIPTFIMRGAGKQTHYEYEVRILLDDGKLCILRRYSRFRELHLSMKNIYGAKIAALPFPRRELFSSNSESVAKNRRRLLELYLRRLITVCSRIPQSPIYQGSGGPKTLSGLTRYTLAQLSPFFKKGLFENGKHGTG